MDSGPPGGPWTAVDRFHAPGLSTRWTAVDSGQPMHTSFYSFSPSIESTRSLTVPRTCMEGTPSACGHRPGPDDMRIFACGQRQRQQQHVGSRTSSAAVAHNHQERDARHGEAPDHGTECEIYYWDGRRKRYVGIVPVHVCESGQGRLRCRHACCRPPCRCCL